MSAEDPGDINVDDLDLGDIGDSGVDADVDISGGEDPGDIRVDVDDAGGEPTDDGIDAGGFGEELGGDPAGDAGRDPDPEPLQPPGGGPETVDEPAPEPTRGVEFAGSGVAFRARQFEQEVQERTGLESEDIRIRRMGDTLRAELTESGQRIQQANLRGTLGGLLADPATAGRRLVSSIGVDERGGQPPLVLVGRGEEAGRQQIQEVFESELGVELQESDIDFEERDGQIVGSLTPEAQQDIQVQQEPLVQLTRDTPAGPVFETGRRIGVRQEAQRARRREQLFGAISQRDRADRLIEDIGLGGARREFESLQTSAQAELANLRQSVLEAGERGAAIAAAPVALPLGIAAEQTGTPPSVFEEAPSPAEEPVAFAAAAAPIAAAEPTPFGEVAVAGTALVGGAALASQQRQQRATMADLETAVEADLEATLQPAGEPAMAEPPGLFVPEQEQPTEPIGRGFFPADFPIGPSRQDLPELLPPTDPQSDIQTGRLTRPELEVPEEPAVDPSPAEVPTPQEPTGEGLFPPEQEVPTAQTASLVGDLRETRGELERERRRQRRQRIPNELIPDETVIIGGGVADEAPSAVGEGAVGPRFIVRPDPRSMELRRIETEEGEFEVGPELTRFLEATELEQFDEPELEPTEEASNLPPGEDIAVELFALESAAQLPGQEQLSMLDPMQDALVGLDPAPRLDERTTVGSITQPVQATVQATDTAGATRTLADVQQALTAESPQFGTPTESLLLEENVPRFGLDTPFETVPDESTVEAIEIDPSPSELPDERRREEDFERRFEFDVLEPLEALGEPSGLDAGEPDTT